MMKTQDYGKTQYSKGQQLVIAAIELDALAITSEPGDQRQDFTNSP